MANSDSRSDIASNATARYPYLLVVSFLILFYGLVIV